MSEKDLNNEMDENLNEENQSKQETEKLDFEADEVNSETASLEDEQDPKLSHIEYEQNDNWEFDASAPSAENSVLNGVDGVEFEFGKPEQTAPQTPNSDVITEIKSQNIVVKKEHVSVILSSLLAVVIIALLVVLGVRYYTVPNSNEKMNPGNVAMTVGDIDVSVGLYNYYYDSVVYEYTYYANYGYYDLDTSTDFSKQYTTDEDGNEISWLDMFTETTTKRIKRNTMYYEKGLEAGITLTDEQKKEIESQLDTVKESASSAGKSANEYSEETFGAHCGIETLRKYMEQYYIAGTYYNQYCITERPTEEETDAYFTEHEGDYKSCSYALIEMNYDTTDETTEKASIETAKQYLSQIKDVDSMRALIPEACADLIDRFISAGYFDNEDEAVTALSESVEATSARTDIENSFGEDIAEWMFSEDNAVGSTTYYVNEDVGVIDLILKTSQPFLEEGNNVYSVRHILVMPESEDGSTDSTGQTEYTDEEWQAAYDKAQEILAEYNAGDKTELSFALLAERYSDDTASTSAGSSGLYGGAYENITPGSSTENFENWALDSSRKYGDVDIVKTEFGYHIMFFISYCPNYMYTAQQDCLNEKSLNMLDSFEFKEGLGMKNVNYASPDSNYVAQLSSSQ